MAFVHSFKKHARGFILLLVLCGPCFFTARAAEVAGDASEMESLDANLRAALQEEESLSARPSLEGHSAADHRTSVYYNMQANRERLNPQKFHGKFGFNFQVASKIKNTMDYTALDFSYGFPLNGCWLELMLTKQTTTFAQVGHHPNHPAMNDPSIKTKNNALMLGVGATLMSDYPQMLFPRWGQKLYATASTYL
ncbi:MAG: hypothetical protein J6Y94_04960, partial [Bacteriovoracaceae bacterium]|nr:hypothetical protein [Bacteriovoracaceae bacterium]